MMKCNQCESERVITRILDEYLASELLGAPFPVYLEKCVSETKCENCGKVLGHSIPSPDELSAVVALLRASDPIKLNGTEIRFLRKTLGLKSNQLAEELRIRPEVLSKYENSRMAIGEVYEQLLRALVFLGHSDSAPAIDLELSTFLNMKVICVRDATKSVSIRLVRTEPEKAIKATPSVKWRRTPRGLVAA